MQLKKLITYISYGFFQMKHVGVLMTINKGLHWMKSKQAISYTKWIHKVESKENKCLKNDEVRQYQSTFHSIVPISTDSKGKIARNKVFHTVNSLCMQDQNRILKISLWLFDAREEDQNWCKMQFERKKNIQIHMCANTDLYNQWIEFLKTNTEEYITILPAGDQWSKQALPHIGRWLNNRSHYEMIYTDEDYMNDNGQRFNPVWKPDWSPDLLINTPYSIHLCLYRRTILEKIKWEKFEGLTTWEYEIALRVSEETKRIAHIPEILYHSGKCTKIEGKQIYQTVRQKAINRRGQYGIVEEQDICYRLENNPLVSIIVLSKDNDMLLIQCLKSILTKTTYPNLEIIIIDNGSEEVTQQKINKWLKNYEEREEKGGVLNHKVAINYEVHTMAFHYSRLCNLGVKKAKGKYLLFLNDDTKIITKDWIERLVGQASLPYSGAVGARLLYPGTDLIQHMGIIQLASGPTHIMHGKRRVDCSRLTHNYLAVTGACLAIERDRFLEVNGFSETYATAWNDVDLCLKLYERGYYNMVRNDVELYHYEAYSRKNECLCHSKLLLLENDKIKLYANHPILQEKDPFYNRNLNQHRTDRTLGYR